MGIFFKDDEPAKPAKKPVTVPQTSMTIGTINTPIQSTPFQHTDMMIGTSQTTGLSEEEIKGITDHLIAVYQKRNLPGPDYQEYSNAINKLAGRNLDDISKFVTTFSAFEAMGMTKAKLIESANVYIEAFKTEAKNFAASIDGLINTEVGLKQKTVDKLKVENDEIDAAIKKLSEKRQKNLEQINTTTVEISNDTLRFQMKKSTFESRANLLIQNITSDIDKIEKYLQ